MFSKINIELTYVFRHFCAFNTGIHYPESIANSFWVEFYPLQYWYWRYQWRHDSIQRSLKPLTPPPSPSPSSGSMSCRQLCPCLRLTDAIALNIQPPTASSSLSVAASACHSLPLPCKLPPAESKRGPHSNNFPSAARLWATGDSRVPTRRASPPLPTPSSLWGLR